MWYLQFLGNYLAQGCSIGYLKVLVEYFSIGKDTQRMIATYQKLFDKEILRIFNDLIYRKKYRLEALLDSKNQL